MANYKQTVKPLWLFVIGVMVEVVAYGVLGMESIVGAIIAILGHILILASIGNAIVNYLKSRKKEAEIKPTTVKASKSKTSKSIIITLLICFTVLIVSIVGGLIYVQRQQIAQKNRELQQQKQLVEYEQEQLNKRNEDDNNTKRCGERLSSGRYISIYGGC